MDTQIQLVREIVENMRQEGAVYGSFRCTDLAARELLHRIAALTAPADGTRYGGTSLREIASDLGVLADMMLTCDRPQCHQLSETIRCIGYECAALTPQEDDNG